MKFFQTVNEKAFTATNVSKWDELNEWFDKESCLKKLAGVHARLHR
jgi:hypothetical protein